MNSIVRREFIRDTISEIIKFNQVILMNKLFIVNYLKYVLE